MYELSTNIIVAYNIRYAVTNFRLNWLAVGVSGSASVFIKEVAECWAQFVAWSMMSTMQVNQITMLPVSKARSAFHYSVGCCTDDGYGHR